MALVNIETVLADTQRLLKKIAPPGGVVLLSCKRNRGIAIIKRGNAYYGRNLSVTLIKHAGLLIKDQGSYLLIVPVFGKIFWFIDDYTP